MSIVTDTKVATLEGMMKSLHERVLALEASRSPLSGSCAGHNNAARRAEGGRLRAAIDGILAAHPEYTAKQVLRKISAVDLGRQELPSVRAVQWHIKQIRNAQSALRAAD
jgi:hypothetical protein